MWVCSDSVFVNDFWFCSSLCALKIWASAGELASGDDFRVSSDSVFVNDFWFWSSICALKISASAVELGFGDDFRFCSDSVFISDFWFCRSLGVLKISASAGELGSGDVNTQRKIYIYLERERWWWMLFSLPMQKSAATQFSLMISVSAVVYARWRFELQLQNWLAVLIFGSAATQFSSMISASAAV
jgi:hypothetical protein